MDIPAYQPPSVPAGGARSRTDIANDEGYRGMMVAFHRPDVTAVGDDGDLGWDVYFRSSNTGHVFGDPAETTDVNRSERVCPVRAARYSSVDTQCRFCGATWAPTPRRCRSGR